MDEITIFLVIVLYAVVAYLFYTKMKMRSVVLELEYRIEELHKRIEEHEGIHVEGVERAKRKKVKR